MSSRDFNQLEDLLTPDDEVDLTNLADPLLVLVAVLILTIRSFAVVATTHVATAATGSPVATESPVVTISLLNDGSLLWNREPLSVTDIRNRLERLRRESPATKVIGMLGESDANYGVSVLVKSEAAQCGLQVKEYARRTKPRPLPARTADIPQPPSSPTHNS